MRHLPLTLLFFVLSALPASDVLAAPSALDVQRATQALQDGDAKQTLSLLSPPPLAGRGTCIYAQALLHEKQIARAMLYWERCRRVDSAADVQKQLSALKKRLRGSKLAPVSVAFSPAHAKGRVSKAYDASDVLLHDEELWLAQGSYRIDVSADGYEDAAFAIEVDSADRMLLPLSLLKTMVVKETVIDVGEEAGSELGAVSTAADPRPKKFEPILPTRYLRAPDPNLVPQNDASNGRGAWPWLATLGGTASVGTGIGLHIADNVPGALVGYGAGAGLLALAGYLFLRTGSGGTESVDRISFSISPSSNSALSSSTAPLRLGIQGRW